MQQPRARNAFAPLWSTRAAPLVAGLVAAGALGLTGIHLAPVLARKLAHTRLRLLRHWGGIMDMTPDGSPFTSLSTAR